jgi:hypothetical protein
MNLALTCHAPQRDLDRPTVAIWRAYLEGYGQITFGCGIVGASRGRGARQLGDGHMPQGPNGQKRPADVIGNAVHIARIATGEIEDTGLKQPAKRASGLAGAKARIDATTEGERSETARLAAEKRWKR